MSKRQDRHQTELANLRRDLEDARAHLRLTITGGHDDPAAHYTAGLVEGLLHQLHRAHLAADATPALVPLDTREGGRSAEMPMPGESTRRQRIILERARRDIISQTERLAAALDGEPVHREGTRCLSEGCPWSKRVQQSKYCGGCGTPLNRDNWQKSDSSTSTK